jgi:hypothetical protein
MTSDRKKPGLAFWATVVAAAVLLYPISFGPACWLYSRSQSLEIWETSNRIYYPILWVWWEAPAPVDSAIEWYANVGSAIELNMAKDDDGRLFVVPIVELVE